MNWIEPCFNKTERHWGSLNILIIGIAIATFFFEVSHLFQQAGFIEYTLFINPKNNSKVSLYNFCHGSGRDIIHEKEEIFALDRFHLIRGQLASHQLKNYVLNEGLCEDNYLEHDSRQTLFGKIIDSARDKRRLIEKELQLNEKETKLFQDFFWQLQMKLTFAHFWCYFIDRLDRRNR